MNRRTRNLLAVPLALVLAGLAAAYDVGGQVAGWEATDDAGTTHRSADLAGKLVVLVWWAPNCPGSKAYASRLEQLKTEFAGQSVVFLGVASDASITAAAVQQGKRAQSLSWPVLVDADRSLARAFGAQVTTQAFVVDGSGTLRYKGKIDDDPKNESAGGQRFLEQAVSSLLGGQSPPTANTPPPRASRIRLD
jgi:peroxiredoxin